jgi:hypothetical protein
MAKTPLAGGQQVLTRSPIVDPKTGVLTTAGSYMMRDVAQRVQGALDTVGTLISKISALSGIQGRVEPIGVTVQNLTSDGQLNSLTNVAADRNLDHIDDTDSFQRTNPNQVSGAGRAFNALDANSKLPGISATPNMQLNAVTFATVIGVDLGATAGGNIYGAGGPGTQWTGQVGTQPTGPYPAGSVSGLSYSTTYLVYYDTINAVFVATITVPDSLNDYYVYVGTFTTPASGGGGGASFTVSMAGVIPNQTVDSVVVGSGGNFTATPAAVFTGGTPSRSAAGYFVRTGSAITGFVFTDHGAGYSATPTLSTNGGVSGSTGGGGTAGTIGGRGSLAGLNIQ